MNKNIQDYVKVYKNQLNSNICDSTVEHLASCKFDIHKFYDAVSKEYIITNDELSSYTGITPLHEDIMQVNQKVIFQYISALSFPWYNSWQGFRSPKYNKYMPGTKMKEHCDHIQDLFDGNRKGVPTLTLICALNNDYTGGEFVMFQDKTYELKKGEIIVFPSNFLYPHRVDTVTTGIRYSYATWVW